jgi:hypothetical protein
MDTSFVLLAVVEVIVVIINILLTVFVFGPKTEAALTGEEEASFDNATSALYIYYLDYPLMGF